MDAGKSVTATFTLKQYALTVSTAGTARHVNRRAEPTTGTVVALTATTGLRLTVRWSGVPARGPAPAATMDAAKSVTATFTLKQYALTVSAAGNGSGTVSPSERNLQPRHEWWRSRPRRPPAHSSAAGRAPAPGTGACSMTMDAAKSVTATFTLKQYADDEVPPQEQLRRVQSFEPEPRPRL
jgi:hypothetical protein